MPNSRIQFEPQRSLAFGSIGAAYALVGTPTLNAAAQFLIQNLTDQTVQFSFDGVNDHFPLPPGSFLLNDVSSNKQLSTNFLLAAGSQLFVKQLSGAATSGAVYFTVAY